MLLRFPDESTLKLALTSLTVPAEVSCKAAHAGTGEDGAIWVETRDRLSQDAQRQLLNWGVEVRRGRRGVPELIEVCCWPQIVGATSNSQLDHVGDRTVVLFWLSDGARLPGLVNELLRQANDRLSFRSLSDSSVLLRVIGPPYYSLLRASDEGETRLSAFVEVAPRVWAPLGYEHPFAAQLEPSSGELLFLDVDPTRWVSISDEPFRDVHDLLSLSLPEQTTELSGSDLLPPLEVPLQLARGGEDSSPEIWVLTDDAVAQLEDFVSAATDRVIDRLAFAVVEQADSEPAIIVRVRPGRSAPPVLVFEGLGCTPYLRIPNLFVPTGQRVHPPLRRDVVRELLAPDESRLVWLQPSADSEPYTSFAPRSIDDSAFLPLANWVDYVLDQHHEALDAWRRSHSFEFERFVCPSASSKPRKKAAAKNNSESAEDPPVSSMEEPPPRKRRARRLRLNSGMTTAGPIPVDAERERIQAELTAIQEAFTEQEARLNAPDRTESWWIMAELNAALNRWSDSSICHQQLVWQEPSPATETLEAWLQIELSAAQAAQMPCIGDENGQVAAHAAFAVVDRGAAFPVELNQIVAWICCIGESAPELLTPQLPSVLRFLEANERGLASRAAWLVWWTVARVAGDELTLARARDRLLERLFHRGVAPDRDLPAFLRSGLQDDQRFRPVRDRVQQLHTQIRKWSLRNLGDASPLTADYVDLIFAWALAQLGESTRALELLQSAREALVEKSDSPDPVHQWHLAAYRYRVEQVLHGEAGGGQLSDSLLTELDALDATNRYRVDTLRRFSTILEPHERLDQYQQRIAEEGTLERRLVDLFAVRDGHELKQQIDALLNEERGFDEEATILIRLLELAPRLGEVSATELVVRTARVEKNLAAPLLQAGLLEKGLVIAAHYGLADQTQAFYRRMVELLEGLSSADADVLKGLSGILSGSFRSLRRMGMKEELAILLERLSRLVQVKGAIKKAEPEVLAVMLQVAGSWFHFGMETGWTQIDAVRAVIFGGRPEAHSEKSRQTLLAVAYIEAIAQAPSAQAMDRLGELFEHLHGVEEYAMVKTHYSGKILRIVETVVRCLVSDGLSTDQSAQRWLDETEYLIRQRIHRDMRDLTS